MSTSITDLESMKDYPYEMKMEWGYISNTKNFVESHLSIIKRNKGNQTFRPYYERLCDFYTKIKA